MISIINLKPKKYSITGKITIDDFEECFDSPLDWWSVEDYELQWKEGLKRLLDHDSSCLVVAINDPNRRKFIEWWPLYKIGNKIHAQNHIIIEDLYTEKIYDFIPQYHSHSEDRNKISEWIIDWQ